MVRVRVAALVVQKRRVLLAHHIKDGRTTYLLPGGGLEQDETLHEALSRELREEAGAECTIGALRYVVEVRAPNGSRHILQLVFSAGVDSIGHSKDPRVASCEWHSLAALRTLPLYPAVGDVIARDLENGVPAECRYVIAPWVA